MSDKAIVTIDESMLNRWAGQMSTSVMDNIHKIKIYNANAFSKDPKEKEIDPDKAGKFRLVETWSWEIKYIDSWFKVDILSVCKVKSGSVFILNEFSTTTDDNGWQSTVIVLLWTTFPLHNKSICNWYSFKSVNK